MFMVRGLVGVNGCKGISRCKGVSGVLVNLLQNQPALTKCVHVNLV